MCPLQAEDANKPKRVDTVADSATRLRGGGDLRQNAIDTAGKNLRLKCAGHLDWTMAEVRRHSSRQSPFLFAGASLRPGPRHHLQCRSLCAASRCLLLQVKECLRMAAKGLPFEPKQRDAAVGGQQRAGEGEQGQRQEQQLHEEEALLQQQAAAVVEGEEGIGQAAADDLLDQGRLLGEEVEKGGSRRATVKRIGERAAASGSALGLSGLSLFGVLLWVGTLGVAFLLLPWARKAMLRSGGGYASSGPRQKGGRSD